MAHAEIDLAPHQQVRFPVANTPSRRANAFRIAAAFALLVLGFMLSFAFDENDSLDTAFWMERGEVAPLLEYRHMIQRMLPLYLWQGLRAAGWQVSALGLLNVWDFITSALATMMLYVLIKRISSSAWYAFAGAFFFATSHAFWTHAGSGRLYSTSLFLIFSAYYLALRMRDASSDRTRWVLAVGAGACVCFASLFWMVHVFSGIGVGLLVALLPARIAWPRRLGYLVAYGACGVILASAITLSCLLYTQVPLEGPALRAWIDAAGTQPLRFDALSPMKAAFGQAFGLITADPLPYMINGLMLKDPHLLKLGSLPWQFGKFALIWSLLLLTYVYPLWLFLKKPEQRLLIAALYIPLAINMFFAFGWLGSDVRRFLPTLFSQIGLAVLALQDLLPRLPRPRMFAVAVGALILLIAGINFAEAILPSQRNHITVITGMRDIRPSTRPTDMLMNFGRDLSITYQTATRFYGGAQSITTTNDASKYDWDRKDWKQQIESIRAQAASQGGRLFVMDRLAMGWNPVAAAWSEKQHSNPTVRQFAEHLQSQYCVSPAFSIGANRYYQVELPKPNCYKEIPNQ